MSTRCCSPPESVADPSVRERGGVDGVQHLRDPLALFGAPSGDTEAVPVETEGDEVLRSHRDVRIERDLLGHVAE